MRPRVLDLPRRVLGGQRLLEVFEEGEGHFLLQLFVSHAEDSDSFLVDVVEVVLLELECALVVDFDFMEELHGDLLEVARVVSVLRQHYVLVLGHQRVVDRHAL